MSLSTWYTPSMITVIIYRNQNAVAQENRTPAQRCFSRSCGEYFFVGNLLMMMVMTRRRMIPAKSGTKINTIPTVLLPNVASSNPITVEMNTMTESTMSPILEREAILVLFIFRESTSTQKAMTNAHELSQVTGGRLFNMDATMR